MQQRKEVLAWILVVASGLLATIVVYTILGRRIANADPGVFAIAAKRMLAGQRLYTDFFEAKPLLASLFYTIPASIKPGSMTAISWLLGAMLLLQATIWMCGVRPRLPTAATCLLFVVLYPATYWDFSWASSEHMSNVFITIVLLIAYLMFRDNRLSIGRNLVAGVAVCLAFHCRQNAVLCSLVPLAVILVARREATEKFRAIIWFVIGGIVAWGAILGVVFVVSGWDGYFYQTFIFPRRLAQTGGNAKRYILVSEMGANSLPIVAGLGLGMALIGRYRRLAMIAFPIGFLACLASPRVHHHYWVNLFPYVTLCLLLGLPRDDVKIQVVERVVAFAMLVCVAVGLLPLVSYALAPSQTRPLEEVAEWVDARSRPGDTLYVHGPMATEHLQYHSRLLPANKYTVSWELDWNDGLTAESFDEILGSYLKQPPTFFLIHDGLLQAMQERAKSEGRTSLANSSRLALELLSRRPYDEVTTLNGFRIYVLRRDLSGRGESAG